MVDVVVSLNGRGGKKRGKCRVYYLCRSIFHFLSLSRSFLWQTIQFFLLLRSSICSGSFLFLSRPATYTRLYCTTNTPTYKETDRHARSNGSIYRLFISQAPRELRTRFCQTLCSVKGIVRERKVVINLRMGCECGRETLVRRHPSLRINKSTTI